MNQSRVTKKVRVIWISDLWQIYDTGRKKYAKLSEFIRKSFWLDNAKKCRKINENTMFSRRLTTWLKYYSSATAISWNVLEKPAKSMISVQDKALTTPLLHHLWRSLEMTNNKIKGIAESIPFLLFPVLSWFQYTNLRKMQNVVSILIWRDKRLRYRTNKEL